MKVTDKQVKQMLDAPRIGKTTGQMLGAPQGAIYVWLNGAIDYPLRLSRDLGRGDLFVISPSQVEVRLRGVSWPVVVDHAARLSVEAWAAIRNHRLRWGLTT